MTSRIALFMSGFLFFRTAIDSFVSRNSVIIEVINPFICPKMNIRCYLTKVALSIFYLLFILNLNAQNASQVIEAEEVYVTYPFSDPNPVPVLGKIYPYFRYDGHTTKSIKTKHKIVLLENDYLKIKIFPEIGGKIWSVVDKSSGKEMFYDNKVIKFRDISLRGPWTSGGIEFNYGVIGHAPSCSFPVNYQTVQNSDGSASCWISDFDLLTRTRWTVEINLPKDEGWFTTSSFWHNANSESQPYYNWVNTGIDATKDLELIFPGTYSISHDGKITPWPIDKQHDKNLSLWVENDFGADKSYHIAGTYAHYFGAYWADEDFGMMHISNRDEKIGKKLFTWALSDQGSIWEELLTDNNGQYVELQSGRLFNQNSAQSSRTPYKQFYFTPYGTDVWTEFWFPFKDTGGVTDASLYGVINISERNDRLDVVLSPLQQINDTLKFYDAQGLMLSTQPVAFTVGETYKTSISFLDGKSPRKITLCNYEIWSEDEKIMNRPHSTTDNIDWNTAYAKYLLGRDYSGMRLYEQAEKMIKESLELDPNYIPSLVEMSRLHYRHMDYDSAYFLARKALSIDSYDPDANFEFGRSAKQLNNIVDAFDGFEIAAITTPLRSAAYTEISKLYLIKKDYEKAIEYAQKSLLNNNLNIEGLQLLYLCYKQKGKIKKSDEIAKRISTLDPFNLLISFETTASNELHLFLQKIRSEMPVQSFLELAIWYYSLGIEDKSRTLLEIAPANAEVKYWLAFLNRGTPEEVVFLQDADAQSPSFVFPFRKESKEVFDWAMSISDSWKPTYYMALLQGSANNIEEARILLKQLEEKPDFSPVYSLRASMALDNIYKKRDLEKAVSLDPNEWRYNHGLTSYYLEQKEYNNALQTIKPFYATHKNHFPTVLLFTRTLTYNQQYEEADKILNTIHILPFEGERGGRVMYREIKMMLATQALAKGKTKEAKQRVIEATQWPRKLGVGKPFDDLLDTRLEDWMNAMIAIKSKKSFDKRLYLKKVVQSTQQISNPETLLQCLAWSHLGDEQKAKNLFDKWSSLQSNSAIQKWGESFYKNNREKAFPFDFNEMSQLITLISGGRDSRLF